MKVRRQRQQTPSFGEMAEETLTSLASAFSNAKHLAQWDMTLRVHAAALWELPVDRITTTQVLETLKPIWSEIPETADRTRQRIERVLDAAEAQGFRPPGLRNPASWKGNLKPLLPLRRKLGGGASSSYAVRGCASVCRGT